MTCPLVHFDNGCCVSLRCANPYDPYVYIIVSSNRHQQRLAILAFQFMEQNTNVYLQEEVSIQEPIMGLDIDSI